MNHPIPTDEVTNDNYRDVANDLFLKQCQHLSEYTARIAQTGWWSDDDTDYLRTSLNATEHLMDIAYDGSCDDLKYFLYVPRRLAWENTDKRETLHEIDSAGGLCEELSSYLEPLYDQEEADEAADEPA
jgi:hypothetical protein